MEQKLRTIDIPFHSILHGPHSCGNVNHLFEIERYYNMVMEAIRVADLTLPRKKCGKAKHFWSTELSSLKNTSIEACDLWKHPGCPKNGPIYLEKNSACLQYKRALRKARIVTDTSISDSLSTDFLSKNPDKFWKNWNKLSSKNMDVSCVDDYIEDHDIANAFAKTFSAVFQCANEEAESALQSKFQVLHASYVKDHEADILYPHFISWSEFLTCISDISMSMGKATGGFVKPYHILHGSPLLALHLHLLFNSFIQHSYVKEKSDKNVVKTRPIAISRVLTLTN